MKQKPVTPITIGYLTPNIAEGNGLILWQNILAQTRAMGARLVTFNGGELRYPEPFYQQANQVYELANRQQLQGLVIWTSSLASFIGPEGISQFCQHYAPLPVVGVGMPLPGIPSIILQSYQGMRQAILHLVQVHGKRRIAFIRGPEHHSDAQERLRAYRDIVAEYSLDTNPDLISPPCRWLEQDATQAMRQLIEERRVKFDSVVAVSDVLAYGALLYLQEKKIHLPQDVAIIGFDNNPIARVCTPPLTTVPNRMNERGIQAVRMLMALIHGEKVPDVIHLETSVKVRQSCGCQDPYIVHAGMPPQSMRLSEDTRSTVELQADFTARLQHQITSVDITPDWPVKLVEAIKTSLDDQADAPFLTTLMGFLQPPAPTRADLREWQTVLNDLRQWIISLEQRDPERLERAERLIHQGRIMIGEITTRSRAYQELLRSRQLNSLHRLRQEISAAETLPNLMDNLASELPKLGITYGCLALYLDVDRPLDGVRLALAFNEKGRLKEIEGQIFAPPTRLVPPTMLEVAEADNIMVHPLYFGAEQLGFLIMDANAIEGTSHQVLREQISSALKNVLLIEQNLQLYLQARQNQQAAEEANLLKSRFLSMVSHELLTPMVLLVGLSEMMLREGIGNRPPLPDSYRQDLTRIHASSQQLGSLVRDVLDLARSQLGKLTLAKKPVHLAEVIEPVELVCQQIAASKGLDWEVNIPEVLPQVMGDASRLQQVILNLVSNAVKFTSKGSVKLSVDVDDGMVTVAVADTGLSVPVEEQTAIFDEFRQSERTVARGYGGLGIGLAICRQLIELHDGKIGVQSTGEENSGSTFYFSLPVLSEIPAVEPAQPSQVVLILTEQVQRCLLLRQYLERHGFQAQLVDTTKTPAWLETLVAAPQGALVLDFPADGRGWEIMETLKKHPATQDLPVIFYSLVENQDSGSMLALDYLTKPVAASSLAQVLQRYTLIPNECSEQRTVLIVDDDAEILALHARMVKDHLPNCQVMCASNGQEALSFMYANPPALVLLDLMMPQLDGMGVLKIMQEDRRLQGIPVIVLTAQQLNEEEMARLNQSVSTVLAKGIFTTDETLAHIEQILARHKRLGSETQRLVRKVMANIHENFAQPINRQKLADFAGVSERHLNRCFLQETGVSPLTYLNRYRIQQAKKLLEQGRLSITEVGGRVGFSESSYFTRIFHREVGVSPSAYKKGERTDKLSQTD
jgi:signal transduction histidine kinase/DNA-binding LacI/PurR family transcriptional regulator/AraC-like DNA-binding protein